MAGFSASYAAHFRSESPGPRGMAGGGAAERREASVEDGNLELRLRRGDLLAWLARAALSGTDTTELSGTLMAELAGALRVDRCVFLERTSTDDEPDRFQLLAAGPEPVPSPHAPPPAAPTAAGAAAAGAASAAAASTAAAAPMEVEWHALAAYLLKYRHAVVAPDLRDERRFRTEPGPRRRGVRAVLAVAVHGRDETSGVLVAEALEPRRFDPAEVDLLESVADLLGLVVERRRLERRSRMWADLLNLVEQAVVATDLDGRVEFWNAAAERLYGWTAAEAVGRDITELAPSRSSREQSTALMAALARGEAWSGEIEVQRKDGTTIPVLMLDAPLRDATGAPVGMVGMSADISERKALESRLQQSGKLESIGRLAGGVAHDFNNILTTIQGHTELLLEQVPADDPMRESLTEVRRGAQRAATLTHQLLAFSRRQVLRPRVLDLGHVVREMEGMLKRLLGEHITLDSTVQPAVGFVRADRAQLEQVLFALAANARDAMPDGGTLHVAVRDLLADAPAADRPAELDDTDCVVLEVSDTGVGMDADTLANAFEPFFTTRPRTEAAGLGLSTVYGIVQQSGGQIRVQSEPGAGTAFRVYLPRVDDALTPPAPPAHTGGRGRETVLLVEDEDGVRALSRRVLQRGGYHVLEARDGEQALDTARAATRPIDLLFTDVVMPRLDGKRLADRLGALHPDMAVLFTSGYTEDAIVSRGVLHDGLAFLEKPFTPEALLDKVRQTLAAHAPAADPPAPAADRAAPADD